MTRSNLGRFGSETFRAKVHRPFLLTVQLHAYASPMLGRPGTTLNTPHQQILPKEASWVVTNRYCSAHDATIHTTARVGLSDDQSSRRNTASPYSWTETDTTKKNDAKNALLGAFGRRREKLLGIARQM